MGPHTKTHMNSTYNENKGLGKVTFHGRLNLRTGKVVAASVGSMIDEDEDFQ